MANLIAATRDGRLYAEIAVVIAPKPDLPSLQRATELGVPTAVVPVKPDEPPYGDRLLAALAASSATQVALAGYLRLLPAPVLAAFPQRVFNIPPALLPKFGGKGMYGIHVHEAVIAARETESGCTVHFVTEQYDEGQIILQERCPVLPDDTPETLAARVLECEHRAYPAALRSVLTP
jgi:phosphoribosylglycinamide formyltransferase-1